MSKFKVKQTWTKRPDVLLCPQIPKPMHGLAPRVVLGEVWWDETRREAYRMTHYHCIACGEKPKIPEAHEIYDIDYQRGRMTYLRTVPLCPICHAFIHLGRTQALAEEGKIPMERYQHVLEWGGRILYQAGLKKEVNVPRQIAWWGDWRMVVNGQLYETRSVLQD